MVSLAIFLRNWVFYTQHPRMIDGDLPLRQAVGQLEASINSLHRSAVILSAVFRLAERDESKRTTSEFSATLPAVSAPIQSESTSGGLVGFRVLLSSGMHRSFVRNPSRSEGFRFLRMTVREDLN